MKSVDPEEISALLDGELAPDRAEQVRRAIADDQEMREVYRQLAGIDSELICYAAACQFNPQLSLPNRPPAIGVSLWGITLGLLAVRILTKVLAFGPALGVQLAALTVVVAWLLWCLLPRLLDDPWQGARELKLNSIGSSA